MLPKTFAWKFIFLRAPFDLSELVGSPRRFKQTNIMMHYPTFKEKNGARASFPDPRNQNLRITRMRYRSGKDGKAGINSAGNVMDVGARKLHFAVSKCLETFNVRPQIGPGQM